MRHDAVADWLEHHSRLVRPLAVVENVALVLQPHAIELTARWRTALVNLAAFADLAVLAPNMRGLRLRLHVGHAHDAATHRASSALFISHGHPDLQSSLNDPHIDPTL